MTTSTEHNGFTEAFKLSETHVEARDMFDVLTNDPDFHFGIDLQPGGIQFFYNHSQLHDRMRLSDATDNLK